MCLSKQAMPNDCITLPACLNYNPIIRMQCAVPPTTGSLLYLEPHVYPLWWVGGELLKLSQKGTDANLLGAHVAGFITFSAALVFDFLWRSPSALPESLVEACIGTAVCRSFRIFFRGAMFHT